MKKLLLSLLFLMVSLTTYSQNSIYLKGKVTKSFLEFAEGDTLRIFGIKTNTNTGKNQYTIRTVGLMKEINPDKVEIIDNDFDYWEMVWMQNRGSEIAKIGWEADKRQELREDALDYYKHALSNNMVFEDDLLYDYLYRLINQIHPTPLIKEMASNFSVVVLNSTETTSFAFDNGMIVLTAGLIASTKSEAQLIHILSSCVAHAVLEHNLINFNRALKKERNARIWGALASAAATTAMAVDQTKNGTFHDYSLAADLGLSVYLLSASTLENIGARYTDVQNRTASVLSNEMIKQFPEIQSLDDYEYTHGIASAITFSAWQEYHLKNYSYSKILVDRLNDMNLATDRDYLLLSRIQRKTQNTAFSNQEALDYILKGKSKSSEPLIDLDKEAGLVYTRLNQPEKAQASFMDYKKQLLVLKSNGQNVDAELQMVNDLLQRRGVINRPVADIEKN